MKNTCNIILTVLYLLFPLIGNSQNIVKIRAIAPNIEDDVYIVGNQNALGNWVERQKMNHISDFEREIEFVITEPLEFRFYRNNDANIDSEGILNRIDDNPVQKIALDNVDTMHIFKIKGWRDNITYDEVNYRYTIERLQSIYLSEEERIVKVFLPENYSASKRYPVIYVLDGSFLFDITADYVRQLTKGAGEGYENIPPSIVVGIFHNDRYYETAPNFDGLEYRQGASKLKNFIENELIPYVDGKYHSSGFNVIVGHSDTGHFVMNLLNQEEHLFGGIIAMSVSLKKNDVWKILADKISTPTNEIIFLGYGSRDDDFNEFAEYVSSDSLAIHNDNLRIERFNSSHLELPSIAIVAGLQFIFKEYRNFDDFPNMALTADFSMNDYVANYSQTNNRIYGIHTEIYEDDYFHLIVNCVKNKNFTAFYKIIGYIEDNEIFEIDNHTYFWLTRDLGDWEAAKEYAYKMVDSSDMYERRILFSNIQAYIDFFVTDLSNPTEAISFLEQAIRLSPEYKLEYAWFIANIAISHSIELHNVKKYLDYCKYHFRDNKYFSIKDVNNL
jgi:predicted alpha/beta superfamily hydrolase